MAELHTPVSSDTRAALIARGRVLRSQAIAGLIRSVISAIRRRFPAHGTRISHTPVPLVDLYS